MEKLRPNSLPNSADVDDDFVGYRARREQGMLGDDGEGSSREFTESPSVGPSLVHRARGSPRLHTAYSVNIRRSVKSSSTYAYSVNIRYSFARYGMKVILH